MSEALQDTPAPSAEDRAGTPTVPGSPQEASEDKAKTPTTATKAHDNDGQDTTEQEKEGEEEQEYESQSDDDEPEQEDSSAPPLPDEVPPPLPDEAPPGPGQDDGWEPMWDANNQAYYFYNRFSGLSQWENPRVPNEEALAEKEQEAREEKAPVLGGYNPAIHGDYDPTASYAQQYEEQPQETGGPVADPTAAYAAAGTFNRFTGRWQAESINPENHNQDNKSYRQMNAFFDVDTAANSHDGRSLRAERSAKKLSKKELKMFKEKRREKKEEKRRAWLRD